MQSALNSGQTLLARAQIETSDAWKTLRGCENREVCYEVLLWIDELLARL
jgi:hypothetical protein